MVWTPIQNDPCDGSWPNDADQVMGNFAFVLQHKLPQDAAGAYSGGVFDVGSNTYNWRDGFFSRNVTIGGNLTVSGTFTKLWTETVEIYDNILLLNSNVTGAATEDGGLNIERGTTGADATLIWDETADKWKCGLVGTELEIVTISGTQILTNKTLTTPTIASFANATHDHSNAAGGGTVNHASLGAVSADQHHAQAHALSGADHTGDLIYTQIDSIVNTAGAGSATKISRSDHAHTGADGSSSLIGGWTNYSASSNVQGYSVVNLEEMYYMRIGNMCFVSFVFDGTSNAVILTATLPFTATNDMSGNRSGLGLTTNNGVDEGSGRCFITKNTNVLTIRRETDAAWTAANQKYVEGQIFFAVQ